MNAQQALLLVRDKYLEEQQGISNGPKAEQYRQACKEYPAMMTTAHYLWHSSLLRDYHRKNSRMNNPSQILDSTDQD